MKTECALVSACIDKASVVQRKWTQAGCGDTVLITSRCTRRKDGNTKCPTKLPQHCVPSCPQRGIHKAVQGTLKEPVLKVLNGLPQLFPTVHDKRAVLDDGLAYGRARH